VLQRAGEAPSKLSGRLSGPLQARTQAHLSLCGARRLAQGSIGGSAPTLFAGFQPLINVVAGNHLRVIVYGSLGSWGGGRSARSHRLRLRRILSMTAALSIRLMIVSGPPQRRQINR
jgi:hypothetical protein